MRSTNWKALCNHQCFWTISTKTIALYLAKLSMTAGGFGDLEVQYDNHELVYGMPGLSNLTVLPFAGEIGIGASHGGSLLFCIGKVAGLNITLKPGDQKQHNLVCSRTPHAPWLVISQQSKKHFKDVLKASGVDKSNCVMLTTECSI